MSFSYSRDPFSTSLFIFQLPLTLKQQNDSKNLSLLATLSPLTEGQFCLILYEHLIIKRREYSG